MEEGSNENLKLKLDLRKVEDMKDMEKIPFLHQEYHPKDVSRHALRRIGRETCGSMFKDLLRLEKTIVECDKPKSLKNSVM